MIDMISLVFMECRNFRSSADGLIDFIVPPSHKNVSLLRFLATGVDYPTKYYSPDIRWRVSVPRNYKGLNTLISSVTAQFFLPLARCHYSVTELTSVFRPSDLTMLPIQKGLNSLHFPELR